MNREGGLTLEGVNIRPAQRRALLAIAFASGLLNSQPDALCQGNAERTGSIIQQFAEHTQEKPEERAFCLLLLANDDQHPIERARSSRYRELIGKEVWTIDQRQAYESC